MATKTIKAWAVVAKGKKIDPGSDIRLSKSDANRQAARRLDMWGEVSSVLPCTITIHTKGAADGK